VANEGGAEEASVAPSRFSKLEQELTGTTASTTHAFYPFICLGWLQTSANTPKPQL